MKKSIPLDTTEITLNTKFPAEKLPLELWQEILSFIPRNQFLKTFVSLLKTVKGTKKLAEDERFWKLAYRKIVGEVPNDLNASYRDLLKDYLANYEAASKVAAKPALSLDEFISAIPKLEKMGELFTAPVVAKNEKLLGDLDGDDYLKLQKAVKDANAIGVFRTLMRHPTLSTLLMGFAGKTHSKFFIVYKRDPNHFVFYGPAVEQFFNLFITQGTPETISTTLLKLQSMHEIANYTPSQKQAFIEDFVQPAIEAACKKDLTELSFPALLVIIQFGKPQEKEKTLHTLATIYREEYISHLNKTNKPEESAKFNNFLAAIETATKTSTNIETPEYLTSDTNNEVAIQDTVSNNNNEEPATIAFEQEALSMEKLREIIEKQNAQLDEKDYLISQLMARIAALETPQTSSPSLNATAEPILRLHV